MREEDVPTREEVENILLAALEDISPNASGVAIQAIQQETLKDFLVDRGCDEETIAKILDDLASYGNWVSGPIEFEAD